MVIHAQLDKKTASFSFDDVGAPDVKDQSGKQLIAVAREELSPKTAGTLTVMETMFRQSFGAMGKGMKLFIFKPDGVSSCGKGGLSVGFAGETYTWETPIPGCSSR
jgi:hypothetical protein